jgi:hypothetical protein
MTTYKYMDADTLAELNQRAVAANYNRALTDEFIATLDPDGINLIHWVMPHEHAQGVKVEPHWRARLFAKIADQDKEHPAEVWLDISDADYRALPEVDSDGNVKAGYSGHGSGKHRS